MLAPGDWLLGRHAPNAPPPPGHGWSFFGKVGGAKRDIGFLFLSEQDENRFFNVVKP